MQAEPSSAIARLVKHHGGPVALSALLGGQPVYQEIQRWVKRGWASPKHLFALEPHLIDGVTLRDLNRDRLAARAELIGTEGAPAVPPAGATTLESTHA